MIVQELAKLIKEIGFPIGVSIYLLVRFDRMMVAMTAASAKELEILYQLRDQLVYCRRTPSHPPHPEASLNPPTY